MSQADKVLKHIKYNGSISTFEAFKEYGITRLASRICDLKERGFEFESEFVTSRNRYGENISFKRYYLKEDNND